MPIQVTQLNICDVCRLLDADESSKVCEYCRLCDSWICAADKWRVDRRGLAALKRRAEPNFKGDPDYTIGN